VRNKFVVTMNTVKACGAVEVYLHSF